MKQGWLSRQLRNAHQLTEALMSAFDKKIQFLGCNKQGEPMTFADLAINDYFICYPLEAPESYHFVFKKIDSTSTETVSDVLALSGNEANRIAMYGINAVRIKDKLGMSVGDEDPVIKVEL